MEIETSNPKEIIPLGKIPLKGPYGIDIVWPNVLWLSYLHYGALVGLYYAFTSQVSWQTHVFNLVYAQFVSFGITCGSHRLWAHRTYKANLPLSIFLGYWQTAAGQLSIYEWSRDHRVHHKFSETDADPHNAKRGFFFSHMGWILIRKHPDVKAKGSTISMTDLEDDPLIMWQHKWFIPLTLLATYIINTSIPAALWGERLGTAWHWNLTRYVLSLHFTWSVNSVAHLWGNRRPNDETINPVEHPVVAYITGGEGWHNYHHTFPWDYKAAELPSYWGNLSTAFIDFCAWIGWATDLKVVNKDVVSQRIKRTGGGVVSGFEGEAR